MRVYALGLLGHTLVGALARSFFGAARPTWYPALSMAAGLAVTAAGSALAVLPWGVHGIAAANAAGITMTAALLLRGLCTHTVAIGVREVVAGLARLAAAAVAATATGWALAALTPGGPVVAVLVGCLAVAVVFLAVACALRAPEVPQLFLLVGRKFRHDR
jgi:putative peptidoglycan lipid II flippase